MPTVSHFVYVDESGNGAFGQGVNSLWVTAALAIGLNQMDVLDLGLRDIRSTHFRRRADELKGADIPHGLVPSSSVGDVAKDCAELLKRVRGHAWVTGSRRTQDPNRPSAAPAPMPKQETRPLLLERINGFLGAGREEPEAFLLIWDISDQQELEAFSSSVARFKNAHTGEARSPRLIPAVVGGLSHDWVGLQLADVFANFALHFWGAKNSLGGASSRKAMAFEQHILPCLERAVPGEAKSLGLSF